MIRFVGIRLLQFAGVLIAVSFFTFLLVHLLPGNPAIAILGPAASKQAVQSLDRQLGLDRSIPAAYAVWLGHTLTGNLGRSLITRQSVAGDIARALPVDIELLVGSQIIALAAAIPLAFLAARRPGGLLDEAASTLTFGMLAIPSFVVAVIMQQVFAVHLGLVPATGFTPLTTNLAGNVKDMLLPCITIAIGSVTTYMRLLRADLIGTLQEDFITLARAKGLSGRRILLRHAFRPSTSSLLTVAGLSIGGVISGAFVVEYLFSLPGVGEQAITAINQHDYLLLQGDVLVFAVLFVLANFLVDLLYAVVDPRVRHAHG